MKLMLFDIDGTLIRTGGAGRTAMAKAFERITGIANGFEGIQMMGRTDPSILREALGNNNVIWNDGEAVRFREDYTRILEAEIQLPREMKRVCPGVIDLLIALDGMDEVVNGLLTGNWRTTAEIKLGYFGLLDYFRFGVFADDTFHRENMVPVALKRWKETEGTSIEPSDIVIIGDTPLDISCAKPHGVNTVGVATGFHNSAELEEAGPDLVFESLEETVRVLPALLKL